MMRRMSHTAVLVVRVWNKGLEAGICLGWLVEAEGVANDSGSGLRLSLACRLEGMGNGRTKASVKVFRKTRCDDVMTECRNDEKQTRKRERGLGNH